MIEHLYQEWAESFNHDGDAWNGMTREQIFLAGVQAQRSSERRSVHNPWSEDDLDTFLRMVDQGFCAAKIANTLGRTRSAVYAKARYFGVKIANGYGDNRANISISDAQVAQIKRLRELGWSRGQVAGLMDISERYVSMIANGHRR